MNIADALNQTADHIEKNPALYDFNQGVVLGDEDINVPACMLARLGQIVGMQRGTNCDMAARAVLGISAQEFYYRILGEAGHPGYNPALYVGSMMAPALRKMAKGFEGIPVEVREIFNVPPAPPPEIRAYFSVRLNHGVVTLV